MKRGTLTPSPVLTRTGNCLAYPPPHLTSPLPTLPHPFFAIFDSDRGGREKLERAMKRVCRLCKKAAVFVKSPWRRRRVQPLPDYKVNERRAPRLQSFVSLRGNRHPFRPYLGGVDVSTHTQTSKQKHTSTHTPTLSRTHTHTHKQVYCFLLSYSILKCLINKMSPMQIQ